MELRYGSPEEVGMSKEGITRVEDVVKRLVDTNNTPSVVTLVARDGVIVSHKAFGTNGTNEDAKPLTTDALFPVCSITKSITAVCIMMLVEEGLVGLNRPVYEYIREMDQEDKKEIKVHHLLTHTSGMTDEDLDTYYSQNKETASIPQNEYYKENPDNYRYFYLSCHAPLHDKPGTVMSYFSFGYKLLGVIIERVTGKSFERFVKERLFNPLGMKDSYIVVPESVRERVVKREAPAIFYEWLTSENSLNSTSPAGGMYTTAMDLAIFCQMLLNKGTYGSVRILSPISVIEMTRNHIPGVASAYRGEFFPEAYWGLGFGINGTKKDGGDLFSPYAYSHWGAAGVFFCVDPVYRTVQIYFSVELDHNRPFLNICADSFNNAVLAAIEVL
jgi:CubicO group peptidase (beta-lactamase class C family)